MKCHFPVCPIHWCQIGASTEASLRQLIWALGSFRHPEPCNSYTAHCTLNTAHWMLHTAHCTLYTAHGSLSIAHCTQYIQTEKWTLHTEQYTLNWYRRSIQNIHLSLLLTNFSYLSHFTAHWNLYTELCKLHTAQCTLYTEHWLLYMAQHTLNNTHFTLWTAQHTLHA